MLSKQIDLWSRNVGIINAVRHTIDLKEGAGPISQQLYFTWQRFWKLLLEAGGNKAAESEQVCPIVLVYENHCSFRLCVAYQRLNATIKPDSYTLPHLNYFNDSIKETSFLTVLDALYKYWKVLIEEYIEYKTIFNFYLGTCRNICMLFVLQDAPAPSKRALDTILSGRQWKRCLIYISDVLCILRTIVSTSRNLTRCWHCFTKKESR